MQQIDHNKIIEDIDDEENRNFIKNIEEIIKKKKEEIIVYNTNEKREVLFSNNEKDTNKNIFIKKYNDIFISLLIFMLLNNKSVIELIYNISFVKDKVFLNLLIRTIIFGVILILYKKLK